MNCLILCLIIIFVGVFINFCYSSKFNILALVAGIIIFLLLYGIVKFIDYKTQTNAPEIWSGQIIDVVHKEEWDQWIPPRTETYTTRVNGKTVTKTRTIPGRWKHHSAQNHIVTSDDGRISVRETPDGKRLTDSFVNSTEELKQYFKIGTPTASVHYFENKVKASYSIYRHKNIKLSDYPNLPEYPTTVENFSVNRLIGEYKNYDSALKLLNSINSSLNDTNNPNNVDDIKSYKQVNIMFVNMGDVTEDYGFALQDYWKGGAKNDFIVAFGSKNNKITWCYPISWTEAEKLKINTRNYMLSLKSLDEINLAIKDIGKFVEEDFTRKEFEDFKYISVDITKQAKIILISISIVMAFILMIFSDAITLKD